MAAVPLQTAGPTAGHASPASQPTAASRTRGATPGRPWQGLSHHGRRGQDPKVCLSVPRNRVNGRFGLYRSRGPAAAEHHACSHTLSLSGSSGPDRRHTDTPVQTCEVARSAPLWHSGPVAGIRRRSRHVWKTFLERAFLRRGVKEFSSAALTPARLAARPGGRAAPGKGRAAGCRGLSSSACSPASTQTLGPRSHARAPESTLGRASGCHDVRVAALVALLTRGQCSSGLAFGLLVPAMAHGHSPARPTLQVGTPGPARLQDTQRVTGGHTAGLRSRSSLGRCS